MNDFKAEMGSDWGETVENNFESLTPMEAIDRFMKLAQEGGKEAINNDPKVRPLIIAMASLKEQDIVAWINKTYPNPVPVTFNFYHNMIYVHCNACRKVMGLDPVEPKIN